jgi:hypothetical protein
MNGDTTCGKYGLYRKSDEDLFGSWVCESRDGPHVIMTSFADTKEIAAESVAKGHTYVGVLGRVLGRWKSIDLASLANSNMGMTCFGHHSGPFTHVQLPKK